MIETKQNYEAKTQALPHQTEAINFIYEHQEVALFDEQGLGKTKIIIDALCWAMRRGEIEGVLVVVPMSLLYIWEQEVIKHSFLIPIILKGSKREKRYKFMTGANFYVTNYEAVIAETQRIKRFCKSRKVAIVLDESARIKDPSTKTAQALFQLIPFSTKRIIITGTPVANKPFDLWSQFYFLDEGKLLGADFDEFKAKFNERSPVYQENLGELKKIVANNSIRRCKNEVLELPEKRFINCYVELSGKQLGLYNKLRGELKVEVMNTNGDIIIDEAENILKKLLRLTQIASNPALIDKGYTDTPVKFAFLDNLLKEIVSKREKAIVWTNFVENIMILKNRFFQYSPLIIYGEIPIKDRAEAVKKFQDSDKNMIMIANPAAAREGLTLTRANNAIYLDRNFNLVDYLQSQDRIHRISQTKECNIYKILAKNTIDEYIDKLVEVKQDIAGYIQGDKKVFQDESYEFLLNKQELLSILG
ncbi:MAG: DEAD/DEAH box helicase [Deltaproteobacteria bacterium]|nr:DEAD/DEAH box helicase [Deltaproteobacteria bacterium]